MNLLQFLPIIFNTLLDFFLCIVIANTYLTQKYNNIKNVCIFITSCIILVILNICVPLSILIDFIILFIHFIYIIISFKESLLKKFKLMVFIFILNNIITLFVNFLLELLMEWSFDNFSDNLVYVYMQKYVNFIVVFVVISFIMAKVKYRNINRKNYIFTIMVLMVLNIIVLLSTFDYYSRSSVSKISFENLVLIIITSNFIIVIVTLLLFNRLQAQLLKMHETEIKALNSERMSEYYRNLAGNTEEIRKFRHDMRYHAQVIDTYLDQGQTLKARDYLNTNIGHLSYRNIIYIEGLPVVSAILSDIQAKCKLLDYRFEPEVYVNYIPMDDDDTSVIIGNILTNALEALEKDSTDDRFILFEIKATAEVTVISCRNHYVGKLLPKGTLYRTTKSNASNHGYGLNTIQERAAKYNGIMEIIPKDQVFHIQIFLPNNNPQSSAES